MISEILEVTILLITLFADIRAQTLMNESDMFIKFTLSLV